MDALAEGRGAHGVVVEAGMSLDRIGAEVDLWRQEFLDECAEHIGVGQARNLVAKLEVLQLVKSFTKSFT